MPIESHRTLLVPRLLALVVVLAVPLAALSQTSMMPHTFMAGQPVLASHVNANFMYLLTAHNALVATMTSHVSTLRSENAASVATLRGEIAHSTRPQRVVVGGNLGGYEPTGIQGTCPTGKLAIAGGVDGSPSGFYARCMAVQQSYPTADGGWYVQVRRHDFGEGGSHCPGGNWGVQLVMLCIDNPDN